MAKPELGTKRVCPETGRKFYDLNKTPVISPYTGKVVPIAAASTRARPELGCTRTADRSRNGRAGGRRRRDGVPGRRRRRTQGKKKVTAETGAAPGEDDEDVEIDEGMDDATFIEEEEEGDADVSDIIGEGIEKEEES